MTRAEVNAALAKYRESLAGTDSKTVIDLSDNSDLASEISGGTGSFSEALQMEQNAER